MNKEYAGKCLAVDTDIVNTNLYFFEWAGNNIKMDRAKDMAGAIECLSSNEYVFIGINGDTVDYMPLLKEMRSMTDTLIMIAVSDYTAKAESAALENGADLYARWKNNPNGKATTTLAHITRLSERAKHYEPLTNIFARTRGHILSYDHLGDLIRSARKFKKMTQAELCDKLNITTRHLKFIESNEKKPSFKLFSRIINELEITDIALDKDKETLRIYAGNKK